MVRADPPLSGTHHKDVVDGSNTSSHADSPAESAEAITKPKPKSTPRSRDHRNRKRASGGEVLSFTMGASAATALLILRSLHGTAKSKTVEATLISEAMRLVSTPKAARALMQKGMLDEQALNTWLALLDASGSMRSMSTRPTSSNLPFAPLSPEGQSRDD